MPASAVGQALDSVLTAALVLVNFSVTLGLLVGFLYSLRYVYRGSSEERVRSLDQRLEALASQLSDLREAIGKIDLAPVFEKLSQLEARVMSLESRTAMLERRLLRLPEQRPPLAVTPKPVEEVEPPRLSKLSDVILVAPEVKYAGVITSQGFIVESYGSCSEEPARLLEVARLYGSSTASIVRGKSRYEVFYLGDVKDISAYGILEFKADSDVTERVIEAAKKAISRYFTEVLAAKKEGAT